MSRLSPVQFVHEDLISRGGRSVFEKRKQNIEVFFSWTEDWGRQGCPLVSKVATSDEARLVVSRTVVAANQHLHRSSYGRNVTLKCKGARAALRFFNCPGAPHYEVAILEWGITVLALPGGDIYWLITDFDEVRLKARLSEGHRTKEHHIFGAVVLEFILWCLVTATIGVFSVEQRTV